jgi:transposase
LLPYNRIAEYFEGQDIFLSAGTIFNFNQEAFELLKNFDEIAKKHLINSAILHSDETGVNINGKRKWLHLA